MDWNIIGHEWAVNLLKHHVATGELRHAYLLTGSQGVGRRTLALRFSQAINCLQPPAPGEPCLTCRPCMQIEKMQHPDLHLLQAEQLGGTLKVDQVRELQRSLSRTPYEAHYQIAWLLRFEEAHISAANALLKTLEEPGSKVILLLTAESVERVIPTIASRCEILRLQPLPSHVLSQALSENWGIPPDEAALFAALSGGRPGYAHYLYQNPSELDQRNTWLDEHARMLESGLVDRFRFAEQASKEKDTLLKLLPVWLSYWRDVLLQAARTSQSPVNLDRKKEILGVAGRMDIRRARQVVTALERTLLMLNQNINTRLALEVLMLELPAVSKDKLVKEW